jgi:protein involved in polysaccharide export with SLBB domain
VRKPGQYEVPVNQPLRLLDAIALAGERSSPWADKIIVTRQVRGEPGPVVIQTGIAAAKRDDAANIRLSPGDVVSVEETPQTALHYILTSIFRFGVGANVPLF